MLLCNKLPKKWAKTRCPHVFFPMMLLKILYFFFRRIQFLFMSHQGWASAEPKVSIVAGGFASKLVSCIAHHPMSWMVHVCNKTIPSNTTGFGKAAAYWGSSLFFSFVFSPSFSMVVYNFATLLFLGSQFIFSTEFISKCWLVKK